MEATRLATTLTTTLAPALPFLLPASSTDQIAGDNIPESALAADTSIWQKILPKTDGRPALLQTAQNLARNPKDAAAREAFHDELGNLLRDDTALFDDLKKEVIHHFVYHHFDSIPPTAAQPSAR